MVWLVSAGRGAQLEAQRQTTWPARALEEAGGTQQAAHAADARVNRRIFTTENTEKRTISLLCVLCGENSFPYPRALIGSEASSATLTHTCTCGEPRKY